MKKAFIAIIMVMLITALCSCGEKGDTTSDLFSSDEKVTSTATSSVSDQKNEQSSHFEYTHAALEGCVIVKSDRLTGECVYKTKCPICGKTSSGTTSTYLKSGTLNSGATCSNAQCSNWGKHFDVKIETTSQLIDD